MKTKANKNDLTNGVVWKKLLTFFLPIAAGTCIQQLYNAVDGLVVGRFVGTAALAAVGGSAAQIIGVLIGFFVAMTGGAAVVIAQIYGAGREEDVRKASGNAVAVCGILGVVLAVGGIAFAPAMLRALNTPDDTLALSVQYLRIYFTGVPFVLILNMESNIMRSVGDSVNPFIYMVAGCVTNIILDFVFVVYFRMGVAGVAVATVIAQLVNFSLLTVKFVISDSPYRIGKGIFELNGRYLHNMIRFGLPSGLESSMYNVSGMLIQMAVNSLGTVVVASWAMTSKTDGIFWAVINALGTAITSFIAQNVGAGKMDRVKQCFKEGIILSLVITVVLCAGLLALGRPLLHILTPDQDVVETTFYMMTQFVPYYFTFTCVGVITAVLRGAGDVTRPVIIVGICICLFRVVWMMTAFARFSTIAVLCAAYPVSWTLASAVLIIYYRKANWMERSKNSMNV